MKFSATLAIAGFAAFAAALPQASETSEAPSVTPAPTSYSYSQDPAQASTLSCISACGAGNVYCAAGCQGLPIPDESALNATYDCVAACPPGGDDAKNAAWAKCQQDCVASNYYTASKPYTDAYALPTTASSGDDAPASTGTDSGSSPTETGGSDASQTSGSPSASQTPNAGSAFFANMPMIGAMGLFLGALVL